MRNGTGETHHRIGPRCRRADHIPDKIIGVSNNAGSAQNEGLSAVTPGDTVRLAGRTPVEAGVVVDTADRSVTVRTEEPHPGILEFGVFAHDGATAAVRWYLYGSGGAEVAARETPLWTQWLHQNVGGVRVPERQTR